MSAGGSLLETDGGEEEQRAAKKDHSRAEREGNYPEDSTGEGYSYVRERLQSLASFFCELFWVQF